MNKYFQLYFKLFHSLFNFCCDRFDNQPPVSYTVNHQESRLAQQLDYLTLDEEQGICDVALYV